MPGSYILLTQRLELIPATPKILTCDRDADYEELGHLLKATIPSTWPPRLLDHDALTQFVTLALDRSDPHFCSWYWVLTRADPADRMLIGCGGTGSCDTPGSVLIGYSVLDEFQNQGYATEAVRCIITELFCEPAIRRIIATTCPELKSSIRVLEKCGFSPAGTISGGEGMEEGTLMYVLERDTTGRDKSPRTFPQ